MTFSSRCVDGQHELCNECECACHFRLQLDKSGPGSIITYHEYHTFSVDELKALYRSLERQYFDYEDRELHDVVNRISKIVNEKPK